MSKMQDVLTRYKTEMEMQSLGTRLGVSGGTELRAENLGNGGHRINFPKGVDFVPFDGYGAELHSNAEVKPISFGSVVNVVPSDIRWPYVRWIFHPNA
jgi:hypothetical protein